MSDANAPKTPPAAPGADPALNAPANIPAATEFLSPLNMQPEQTGAPKE